MRHFTDSRAWRFLIENGPATKADGFPPELITNNMRAAGLSRFSLDSTNGSSITGMGTTVSVYYIEGEHTPFQVVQRWLDANKPGMLDRVSDWSLHMRIASHGDGFREASGEILEPSPHDGGHNGDGASESEIDRCEMCLKPLDDERNLAEHLPDCPEEPQPEYAAEADVEGRDNYGDGSKTDDCPLCGGDLDGTALSYHLPDCPVRGQVAEVERL